MLLILFPYLLKCFITTTPIECSVLQTSHLSKLGDRITITCPTSFVDLGVQWSKEDFSGDEIENLGKEATLTLNRVELKDSGKYVCVGKVMTSSGIKTNRHETKLLVVDYNCFLDKSQNIKCSMTYEESKDGEDELLTYRLCEPLQQNGIQIDTLKWKDGNKINRVLIIEKDKQHCIFMIGFINSTLRIWPDNYQCLSSDENETDLSGFFYLIILAILHILVIALLSISLSSLRLTRVLQTKLAIQNDKLILKKNNGKSSFSSYEEIEEKLYLNPIIQSPI